MRIGFVALETFVPTYKYIEGSKLYQVEEVISLDSALCPSLIKNLDGNNKDQLGQWGLYSNVFTDLDWVLQKVKDVDDKQILAVLREPEEDFSSADMT